MLPQIVEDVVEPHLPQAVKQRAGVVQHDARLLALADQLRNEFAHALVAPVKHGGVVVVADSGVVHHVLQIADDGGGAQVIAAGRDQRLMHVQRDGGGAANPAEIDAALARKHPSIRAVVESFAAIDCSDPQIFGSPSMISASFSFV